VTEADCWRSKTDVYLSRYGLSPGSVVTGQTGGKSGDFLGQLASIASLNADLAFIELGVNDSSGGVSLTTFEANMHAISDAVRDNRPGCILIYMTTWTAVNGGSFDAVIRRVAAAYGGLVADISGVYYANDSTYLPAGVSAFSGVSDGWHPNNNGHAVIANIVGKLLGESYSEPTSGYPYCTVADALALLPSIGTLTDGPPASVPSATQAQTILDAITSEIDMHLRGQGYAVPATDTEALASLKPIAMNGVAARIAKAKWPTATGAGGDGGIIPDLRADYAAGLAYIDGGGLVLDSGTDDGSAGATVSHGFRDRSGTALSQSERVARTDLETQF
jgi:lysophospholipase L1-like esterase